MNPVKTNVRTGKGAKALCFALTILLLTVVFAGCTKTKPSPVGPDLSKYIEYETEMTPVPKDAELEGFQVLYNPDGMTGTAYAVTCGTSRYTDEEGKEIVNRYLYGSVGKNEDGHDRSRYFSCDFTDEEYAGLVSFLKSNGIFDYNGWNVTEKDLPDSAALLQVIAQDADGGTYGYTANGENLPEGFEQCFEAFFPHVSGLAGYYETGYTNFVPNATERMTEGMSSKMAEAKVAKSSEYDLFAFAFVNNNQALVKNPYYINDYEVIQEGCIPFAIQFDPESGAVFYMNALESGALYRYDEGGTPKIIASDVSEFCVSEGAVYFAYIGTSNTLYMYDIATEATGIRFRAKNTLGFGEFYVIEDWLLAQIPDDGYTYHAINLNTEEDIALTDEPVNCPILSGNELYYFTNDEMKRKNLITWETESFEDMPVDEAFYIAGDYIYCNAWHNGKAYAVNKNYMKMEGDPQRPYDTAHQLPDDIILRGASENEVYYTAHDSEGYIKSFWRMCNYYDGDMSFWLNVDQPNYNPY